MIVDTSAILAILFFEPERERFRALIAEADTRRMSTVSYLEASIVMYNRYRDAGLAELDLWIEKAEVDVVPFSQEHATAARRAHTMFGKTIHKARLNFGDCAAYALATAEDLPLLYEGEDFNLTDVQKVIEAT